MTSAKNHSPMLRWPSLKADLSASPVKVVRNIPQDSIRSWAHALPPIEDMIDCIVASSWAALALAVFASRFCARASSGSIHSSFIGTSAGGVRPYRRGPRTQHGVAHAASNATSKRTIEDRMSSADFGLDFVLEVLDLVHSRFPRGHLHHFQLALGLGGIEVFVG